MSAFTLGVALETKLAQLARAFGEAPEKIVEEAVAEHLDELNQRKLDLEIAAWEQRFPELRAQYANQFVALHQGEVVDADSEFEPLFLRVQERFGELAILIRQVGETPDESWAFRSPRLGPQG